MKIILNDNTELNISRVRVTSGEETLSELRAVISIDKSLTNQTSVEQLRDCFSLTNIANITFKSKNGDETMQFTAVEEIVYVMNDYENKFDVILEYKSMKPKA